MLTLKSQKPTIEATTNFTVAVCTRMKRVLVFDLISEYTLDFLLEGSREILPIASVGEHTLAMAHTQIK
jgi:hypothetical protein